MSADKHLFIRCECQGEGIGVDYESEGDHYYFSYWSYGLSNKSLSWKQRLRYCWNVLIKGKAFNDEIIMSQSEANKLSDFLLSCPKGKSISANVYAKKDK